MKILDPDESAAAAGFESSDDDFIMDELSILQLRKDHNRRALNLFLFDFLELPAASSLNFCYYCEESTSNLKKCSRCRNVSYCSIECQRTDWKRHKVDCT